MQAPGIHHLSIEGDYEAGIRYLGDAYEVLQRLQDRLRLGGIQTGGDWEPLDGGAWLYARVAMGINAVRIVVPAGEHLARRRTMERTGPPDFVSGVVVDGTIETIQTENGPLDQLRSFWPTPSTVRKFGLPEGLQSSVRLAVPENPLISVSPAEDGPHSQYAGIRPSMYSGAMKAVVQLLLGYGKPGESIYQQDIWQIEMPERSATGTPGVVTELAVDLVPSVRLEPQWQVGYDFRAYRTHGISFDVQGRPWLIEISSMNGVIGMPLPLFDETQSEAFRARIEDAQDDEALAALDLLGGFPTGATFPASSEGLKALLSSGYAVQMLDAETLLRYYSLTPYSSGMGWAFNLRGTEAHNTGFGWGEDHWQFGEHYALSLAIGAPVEVRPPRQAPIVQAHILTAREAYGGPAIAFEWYLQKIGRLSDEQADDLLRLTPAQAFAALREMAVPPVASATANLSRVSRGALVNGDVRSPNQAKFWEPLMDNAIVSHDFSPDEERPGTPAPERCDTTMLVFFAGNDLKVLKWFVDARRRSINEVESDEEACMYVGTWTRTQRTGTIGPGPGYYSSDHDFREEKPDVTSVTITTGSDLGWTRVEADWPNDWPVGGYCEARRYRTFMRKVEHFNGRREESISAFVWPAFAREAYYLALRKTVRTESHSIGHSYLELKDPNNHVLFIPYTGPSGIPMDALKHCGNSGHRRATGDTNQVGISQCTELIDEGPWMNECQVVDNLLFNTPLPPLPAGESQRNLVEVEHKVKFVSAYFDPVDLKVESELWYEPSPAPESPDSFQFMYATGNCFGGAECAVFSRAPNAGFELRGVPDFADMKRGAPCFVGVVN